MASWQGLRPNARNLRVWQLGLLVAVFGPALTTLPIDVLRLVIGTLVLLFGLQWLRKAILRSSEVITYRGHLHNDVGGRFVDYRTGPVYERGADGGVALRRAALWLSILLVGGVVAGAALGVLAVGG